MENCFECPHTQYWVFSDGIILILCKKAQRFLNEEEYKSGIVPDFCPLGGDEN